MGATKHYFEELPCCGKCKEYRANYYSQWCCLGGEYTEPYSVPCDKYRQI